MRTIQVSGGQVMVEIGQPQIVPVSFRSGVGPIPVETFQLQARFERDSGPDTSRVERLGFHLVMMCTAGSGRHRVDFTELALTPGRVVHVLPGQVQQWIDPHRFDAHLVLAESAHVQPSLAQQSLVEPPRELWERILRVVDEIAVEQSSFDGTVGAATTLNALFDLLVARVHQTDANTARPGGAAFTAYVDALDAAVETRPTVAGLAIELGYSPKTITRACRAAVGKTAKQVLDERVGLEAQRLLAHGADSAEVVARRLGFTEATNFSKFFARVVGETPGAFQRANRA